MEKDVKKTLAGAKLGSVCLVLAGIVLLVNPDFGSAAVSAVLGWGLVIIAAVCLIASVLIWPTLGFGTIVGSGAGLLLGIYILRNPLSLMSLLGMLLGAFLAVQGLGSLGDVLRLRRNGQLWVPGMVVAVLTLGMGVYLIFSPLTTSRIVMNIAGIVMIVCGVGNLVTHARASRYIDGSSGKDVIDAE